MNSTRTNLINKICAILAIFALTVSDFVFVGKSAVSYAIDAVKTNNVNVEFSAYFQDESGEKIQKTEENIDKKQYLYVDVSVKNEGYFNGEIKIADENFNIKSDELDPQVTEIKDNVVKLKQINAGETETIELAIEPAIGDTLTSDMLLKSSDLKLMGTYMETSYKGLKIDATKQVNLDLQADQNTSAELTTDIITNKIFSIKK